MLVKVIAIAGKARNGKTTSANIFKSLIEQDDKKAVVVSYAGYVKYVCETYYGWDGKKDEAGRTMLQNVGDGFRIKYSETYWVDRLMSDIYILKDLYDYVIIDDCRYPNEIIAPQNNFDTVSIVVKRELFESELTEEQKTHASEVALDNFNFDYTVSAMSGIENLMPPISTIYKKIKCGE